MLPNPIIDADDHGLPAAAQKAAGAQRAAVAQNLIAALAKECKSYCILSGYENLPDSFDTDIDFMVSREDFERIPQLLEGVARVSQARLFHSVEHEVSARAYWLAINTGERIVIVQPDSTADYRHFGLRWLKAQEVLAARRWHSRGFWIPSAAHEFSYYLLKRVNKRSFNEAQGEKLHRLYLEDREGCDAMIARFWKGRNRGAISRMALTGDWEEMRMRIDSFRSEMRRNPDESRMERIASIPDDALHDLKRIVQPTGGWIAVMGPDGAGKSAVIDAIRQEFACAYQRIRCFHLRPKSLRPGNGVQQVVTDPHGRPPRGFAASIAKVLFLFADYWLGFLLKTAPGIRRSQLIIFDRYVYDLLVDSKRIRYGGPAWLLRLLARVVPKPELLILLDAPPEVLWSRKREVPFAEVRRQREEYLRSARTLPFARVINAAQPLPDVIRDVNDAIVEYFAKRTAKRLHLVAGEPGEKRGEAVAGEQC